MNWTMREIKRKLIIRKHYVNRTGTNQPTINDARERARLIESDEEREVGRRDRKIYLS